MGCKLDVEMEKEQQKNPSAQIRFSHAQKLFCCIPQKKTKRKNTKKQQNL